MKKSKKFFTEERVDEIFDIMFDLAMGLGNTHDPTPNPL